MTDKITFYLNDANNNNGIPSGSVVISEDNLVENPTPANLYANLNKTIYKIGPDYTTEIKNLILKNEEVQEAIGTQILRIIGDLGWLETVKSENDTKLNFKIANELPQTIVDGNISLTTTQLQNGIENGTFIAGSKTITIGGLKSMAYEDAEDYIPAEYCPLKQPSDGEEGEGGAQINDG